jgi:hypothetical protein
MAQADHPTIQVNVNSVTQPETFSVGMLGVINGVLERATGRRVAAKFSDDKQRPALVGFVEYMPVTPPVEQSSVV